MWLPRQLIWRRIEPRSESPLRITVAWPPSVSMRRMRPLTSMPAGRRPSLKDAYRSGGVALVGAHQHRRQRIPAARAAHLLERRRVAGDPADRGQGLEMLGA